jgi:hypothetical protein
MNTDERRGHGEKLSRKQEDAIAALLTHGTVRDAAKACKVGEATLFRWLQIPSFHERYTSARREVLQAALTTLQSVARAAVVTLAKNLRCGIPAVEVSAARVILDQTFKASEIFEMEERIERLEQLLETHAAPISRKRY